MQTNRYLALITTALLAGCAGAADSVTSGRPSLGSAHFIQPASGERGPRALAVPRHAYVGDIGANAVFRYPIIKGKLAAQPDSAVTGVDYQVSVVGIDGTVYVNRRTRGGQVAAYAPGATGNAKPTRILEAPVGSVVNGAMAVDSSSYLYVPLFHANHTQDIAVYAPGASGRAHPVAVVSHNAGAAMAVDQGGNLYVSYDGVQVYANPRTSPTLVRSICFRYATASFGGMALTQKADYILKQTSAGVRSVAAFSQNANGCPAPIHPVIRVNQSLILESTAIEDRGLYITGYDGALSKPAIFQFDATRFGDQSPVNTVSGPPLQQPREIYFGP